jgi:hypothetical protein
VDDGAGKCPGDAGYPLDLGDHQPAEQVDVVGLGPDNDVIRPGDVVRLRDTGDLPDADGDVGCLPDRIVWATLP